MELERVDPSTPGWTRRRAGKGWSYRDESGALLRDPAAVGRLRTLAIPPAWTDVWISPLDNGHIQAIGTDVAGRRQYRYHEEWRRQRDLVKHDRVLRLGERMPAVREVVAKQIDGRGITADRVLGASVRMLDIGVFRVGGEEYAPATDGSEDSDDEESSGSFGLATIRRDHVRLHRGAVVFNYPAKGGIDRSIALRDGGLHKVVGALLKRRGGGEELLAYRTGRGDGAWRDVKADDINAHLKQLAGDEFTAKDLRTWGATVLAAVSLAAVSADGLPDSDRARARVVNGAVDTVSEHLGNTRTVARASYVDPRVIEHWEKGETVLPALLDAGDDLSDPPVRIRLEAAVLDLLRS